MGIQTYTSSNGFDSIEALERASIDAGFKVCYRQLESGELVGKSILAEYKHGLFLQDSINRSVEVTGSLPSNITTILVPQYSDLMRVNGEILSDQKLIYGQPDAEFIAYTQKKQKFLAAHISEKYFTEQKNILFPNIDDSKLDALGILKTEPYKIEILKHLINSNARLDKSDFDSNEVIDSFILTFLKLIYSDVDHNCNINIRNKFRIFKKGTSYIQEHISEDIKISDICEYSNCSFSTLERIFKEEIGVSPKKYLTIQRLNLLRRKMNEKKYSGYNISELARETGFNHLSRLSYYYKNQFGVSPMYDR